MSDGYSTDHVDAHQRMREALQDHAPTISDSHADLDEAVITGWVAVLEWMAPDGSKWLQRLAGDAGDSPLVSWDAHGLHHEALYGDWPAD